MDQGKVTRVLKSMEEHDVPQMIVSDPVAIFYLTGKWIFPGERLLALYLNVNGNHKFVINKLFPQEGDLGVDMIKDEKEQDLMRKSSKINDVAMEKIIPWVSKGLTEKELNAKMREIYKELGCEDVSFDPITAYGHGAADPHHVTDDSKGKRGDCVILDIGGFKDNYASDMTRTVFIGEVSDRAKEIYDIVVEANRRGIEAAKPGARMCDVDLAARNYIEEKGFGEYFTHRTGHSIGLEDHEFGDVSSVNTDIIQVGQCFSVEPGIYLPDENIGVRIEDLVIITEDGCEVLNDFTKDLIIVPEE